MTAPASERAGTFQMGANLPAALAAASAPSIRPMSMTVVTSWRRGAASAGCLLQ
ncbi:hypothetical protein D3C71_2174500 [compost metagenome]